MPKQRRFGIPKSQFEYTKAVAQLRGVSARVKKYANALSDHVDQYGGAFPGYKRLADSAGDKCTKTVQRAVADMRRIGVIRTVRTTRAEQGYSSYHYALVLSTGQPTGQYFEAIRQNVPIPPDKESVLNKVEHQNKEQQGRFLILRVEEYLLHELSEVLDFRRHPHTVRLGPVSRWLFNGHSSAQFEPALLQVLDQAKRLRADYLNQSKRIGSWTELTKRVQVEGQSAKTTSEPSELHPIVQEIWDHLPKQEKRQPRSIGNLSRLSVRMSGAVVIIESTSGTAIRYVLEVCAPVLSRMERAYGYKFDVRTW